ncbi:amino acid permease [Rhodohalobacter sp.]|uniref:amino acid permease n=1 Tax=Rhodohalobacter sp. TaxID=1974210 RepID=UPI002ACDD89D|nr:amino acid permease [Rhodohalobacter sp.]MDZ7756464.1 amino acid permease [Rhodohalobacter sp.]
MKKHKRLKKDLKLFDVYAISTGAMFSSGFFLLPGLAAAQTGPSVVLAYFVAGILILPAMFSVAELSTAMPRAGGAYYFIDRSLGPLFGTVGGMGSWLALIFKSAFALIGMGAYIAIFIDLPITPVAIALTIFFGITNVVGAKESSWLQNVMVATLVSILFFYVFQGAFAVIDVDFFDVMREEFTPFFEFGPQGFFATIGFVFVSYAGLTKVASVSEEVQDPDRNIPLGMMLSLATATFIYVVGVFIMVMVLEPDALHKDLTPVATAGELFLTWLPGETGLILVVIAAIAAFASTANAGIMSAARYPLAMARDELIPTYFSKLGRFGTPTIATVATTILMIFLLVTFNVEAVAKLASAFQLLLFGILNISVVVMRESKIEGYDPGFKSPWYPWMQIAGFFICVFLIAEMGLLSVLFTVAIAAISVVWYFTYSKEKVEREGAIYHVYAKLGKYQHEGLEREMRSIMREKGLRKEDPYEKAVGRALVLDLSSDHKIGDITEKVSKKLADRVDISADTIYSLFVEDYREGIIPVGHGCAIKHIRIDKDIDTEVALIRIKDGLPFENINLESHQKDLDENLNSLIYLISSTKRSGQHLRILAHLAEMIDTIDFRDRWLEAKDEAELREILLRDERFINLRVSKDDPTKEMINKRVKNLDLPGSTLITVIKRGGEIIYAHGKTRIENNDRLSLIGDKEDLKKLKEKYEID